MREKRAKGSVKADGFRFSLFGRLKVNSEAGGFVFLAVEMPL